MNWNLVRLETVDSTNNYIKTIDGDSVVVTADFQLSGRGQGDNFWESERGKNLLISVKIKEVPVNPKKQYLLSMAGALALKYTLDKFADGFKLKWPNDIYWEDKKVSGTLIETTIKKDKIQQCIFGVGVNVNQIKFPSSTPNPVSLCQIVNNEVDRGELFKKLLSNFEYYYLKIIENKEDEILKAYNENLYRSNGYFEYEDKYGCFEAKIIEVLLNGYLVLCDREGKIREYEFKEVKFII